MWLRMAMINGVLLGSFACVAVAQEAAPTTAPEDRVAIVKDSFVASKEALRQYEWIETVALSLGGEEKIRQQYRCYFGAEGALQKVPVAADAKEEKKRGLRGKVVESKQNELKASLKGAMDLLRQYVPLDPVKIQAAKDAGNVSVSVPAADGLVRITIKNYLKPGDEVGIEMDTAKNTLQTVSVTTFVEQAKEKNPVSAKVSYAALQDGTIYPVKEALAISAQGLNVDVQNSGYRKQGQ
jgi:hypothetical protein